MMDDGREMRATIMMHLLPHFGGDNIDGMLSAARKIEDYITGAAAENKNPVVPKRSNEFQYNFLVGGEV